MFLASRPGRSRVTPYLHGITLLDGPSIDREFFIIDFQPGFVLNTGWVRSGVGQTFPTCEFDGEDNTDLIGALTISVRL